VFANRWALHDVFAHGSTSEVFHGIDRTTGAPVAVKVLRADVAAREDSLQRFRREARVSMRLSHPNIVTVLDCGVDDDRPWIVMELLEGETLETRTARGRLAHPEALDVIDQIAAAVDVAHTAGIVHRDLKPDNVFVLAGDGPPRVKVLDFGFAKVLDALEGDGLQTAANALLGTPLYMAPEQIRSSSTAGTSADLWSLAVVAYELLAGVVPFNARSTADVLVQIVTTPPPPPTSSDASLPPALDRWVARALHPQPERRFATAVALAEALRLAMDPTRAHHAAPTTAPHPAVHARERVATRRWGLMALMIATATAAVALLWALAAR
jgi:serine/threonine-protein kinase